MCAMTFAASRSVGSIANIFGAGQASAPGGATFGAGVLPPGYSFAAAPGQVLYVNGVSGFVGTAGVGGNYSPNLDGHAALVVGTQINSQQGIAGIKADAALFLTGVFLNENAPTGTPPTMLDFTSGGLGESFANVSPQLGQVFFIGDGLTGTGTGAVQQFLVPPTATRLFLGFADGIFNGSALAGDPDTYTNNVGGLGVTLEIVPEPAAVVLLLFSGLWMLNGGLQGRREN
jgi:hypothetical protein